MLLGGSARFISQKVSVSETLLKRSESLAAEGKTPLFFAEVILPAGDPVCSDGVSGDLTAARLTCSSAPQAATASAPDPGASGRLLGIIAVADTIKEDSAQAIRELENMGISVVMVTGDNEHTANAIGAQAGVDRVIAGVLPDGKEAIVRQLRQGGAKVAMVGDGINDAPALTRADVGVAIGAGADVAIDAADIVLMKSRLSDVSAAVRLSRATIRNIHENLFWAFFYNALCIPFAMGIYGIAMKPMYGAAAMACSSFFVCMNALRLNLLDIRDAGRDRRISPKRRSGAESDINNISTGTKGAAMSKTVCITGMMCPHCEARVKKALEEVAGITAAEVSHEKGTAVIETSGDVSDEAVTKAVTDAGYEVTAIR